MALISVRNLEKSYGRGSSKVEVLKNINIDMAETGFISILGRSGSGKTTFLNTLSTLLPYDKGSISIDGNEISKLSKSKVNYVRNQYIGFIFQSFNLLEDVTILDNVAMPLVMSGVSYAKAREKATECLFLVGLDQYLLLKPKEMSGGQQQRVAIARAMVNDQKVILCDEPTGALDDQTGIEIMSLLKELSQTKLIIMVTHDEEFAKEYSNRIIILHDGEILSDTSKNSVSNSNSDNPVIRRSRRMGLLNILKFSLLSMSVDTKQFKKTFRMFSIALALFILLQTVTQNMEFFTTKFFSWIVSAEKGNKSMILDVLYNFMEQNIVLLLMGVAYIMLFFCIISYLFVFVINIYSKKKEIAVLRAFGASKTVIALMFTFRPIRFAFEIMFSTIKIVIVSSLLLNGVFKISHILVAEYFEFFKNIFTTIYDLFRALILSAPYTDAVPFPLHFIHFVPIFGIILALFMLGSLIPSLNISRKNTIRLLASE